MSARDYLRVLGSKYSVEILEATGEPRSAQSLSDELEIPIATCYRRLEEMADMGLLAVHQGRSESGRQTDLFRRDVDELTVTFGGSTEVTTEERTRVSRTVDRLWRRRDRD